MPEKEGDKQGWWELHAYWDDLCKHCVSLIWQTKARFQQESLENNSTLNTDITMLMIPKAKKSMRGNGGTYHLSSLGGFLIVVRLIAKRRLIGYQGSQSDEGVFWLDGWVFWGVSARQHAEHTETLAVQTLGCTTKTRKEGRVARLSEQDCKRDSIGEYTQRHGDIFSWANKQSR